jgi:hypothetical protein
MSIEKTATTALPSAAALADANEVILNQGGVTVRGALTLLITYIVGKIFPAWTTWAPTVAFSTPAGSGFVHTLTDAKAIKIGKLVFGSLTTQVNNLGTGPAGSGYLTVTLPYPSARKAAVWGFEDAVLGQGVAGRILAGSSLIECKSAAGTNFTTNSRPTICFCYETSA